MRAETVATLDGIGFGLRIEVAAEIAVLKALECEFAVQDGAEERGFLGTNGPQRSIGSTVTGDPLTDRIEQAVRRDRVTHHAERVEIARGGRAAQVGATAHVGNPASEREPVEPPIARASAEDLETVRVVEGHFHAQQPRPLCRTS